MEVAAVSAADTEAVVEAATEVAAVLAVDTAVVEVAI